MDSIANIVRDENDILYIVGQKTARIEEQTKFVRFLLKQGIYTFDQIADIADVSIEFAKNVKQKYQ